ncbi:efflux RND transporter periplasmic adaptor subunit [Ramlibacter sp. XY19]|uniref:PqqD family peptide modification chaperone n=1 Tax=Ramlibacter paludis TaxID=2908000 RepID=UPI0023DA603A|nr:PqqD family peptide modification chaperone [Ramlibacter paludis]MCG2593739.1 efflux RND transporter periplasmic adaptor subunit [Ramlibacter paludis]
MAADSLFSPSWYRVAELRPRLRGHLRVHRHEYRGQRWYVLEDLLSRRMHRFNPAAHHILGLMDGRRTVQELWDLAATAFGDDAPTQDELIRLLAQLHAADVLQSEVSPDVAELLRRTQKHRRQQLVQRWLSPLAVRIPLFDPDRLLQRLLPWYRPLFTRAGFFVWLAIVLAAGLLAAGHWRELAEDVTDRVLAPQNLLLIALTFPVVKLLHEFGHACAVKAWGGEVHDMGVMLLVLMPVPYVDASASSAFRETRRRAVVGAAGVMAELLLASLALLLWLELQPGMARAVMYDVMLIAGVSTVLFNGNPLLRFDGYYVLSDLLQIPNMRSRGQQLLVQVVESRLFGVDAPPVEQHPRERAWLLAFTVASFFYRIAVMLAIALFIAREYFFVGVLLALWSVAATLVWPLVKGVAYLARHNRLRRRRLRAVAVSTGIAVFLLLLLFALPMPLWTRAEGVTWTAQEAVIAAGTDGFVQKVLAPAGGQVERGTVLVTTEDPALAPRIRILQAQLDLLEARARAERDVDRVRWQSTQEEIKSTSAELAVARERYEELVIRSPLAGVLFLPGADDLPDRFLRKGQQVAFVLPPGPATVRVLVSQDEVDLVRSRTRSIEIKRAGALAVTEPARLLREVPAASRRVPNPALTAQGGGLVATDPRPGEPQAVAMDSWFEFELQLPQSTGRSIGERVHVRFLHDPEPLAHRLYRSVRQVFLSRLTV